MPTVLMLNRNGINEDDAVTSQIDNMVLPFAGAFTGKPADGLKETVLLQNYPRFAVGGRRRSQHGRRANHQGLQTLQHQLRPGHSLDWEIQNRFPRGQAQAEKRMTKTPTDKPADPTRNRSSRNPPARERVILVGDSDMINDQVCVQVQDVLGYMVFARSTAI